MKVLVLNAGSSSLKYQLFDMANESVLAKWLVERIWIDGGIIKHKWKNDEKIEIKWDLEDHSVALEKVLHLLIDSEYGVIENLDEINAVWHRVVHGGEYFQDSTLIDDDVKIKLKELISLAPLHNPANIMWIEAVERVLPGVPNIGVFDTAFHQTMEPSSYIYPIPYKFYEKYKIRRYGFHWTSHKYVAHRAAEILGKDMSDLKMIVCHVWNGASVTAINWWKVIDTSMGFTPLEWLVMWTRSGDIDPAIIHFLMTNENMTSGEIDKMLNKESWVIWISEISSDMREIEDGHIAGSVKETLALDIYVNKILKYIWSYVAMLDGCDALVLTAGVLENSAYIRKMMADRLGRLGIKLDDEKNNFRWEERIISTPDSSTIMMVVPTNEEYMIAKDTMTLLR